MKITEEDYQTLRKLIIDGLPVLQDTVRKELIAKAYRHHGLPPKRLRWDILRAAKGRDFVMQLYTYLDDTHVDTALRTVMRSIGFPYAARKD